MLHANVDSFSVGICFQESLDNIFGQLCLSDGPLAFNQDKVTLSKRVEQVKTHVTC